MASSDGCLVGQLKSDVLGCQIEQTGHLFPELPDSGARENAHDDVVCFAACHVVDDDPVERLALELRVVRLDIASSHLLAHLNGIIKHQHNTLHQGWAWVVATDEVEALLDEFLSELVQLMIDRAVLLQG